MNAKRLARVILQDDNVKEDLEVTVEVVQAAHDEATREDYFQAVHGYFGGQVGMAVSEALVTTLLASK
jgi:hypothetical protein